MALHLANSVRTQAIPTPYTSGAVHQATFTHTISTALGTGDIVEIGALPAGCQVVEAMAFTSAAAATFDVGFMSGTYGDASDARTVGAELFDDVARNGNRSLAMVDAAAIATSDSVRGIGVALSVAEAAGSETITVVIRYVA